MTVQGDTGGAGTGAISKRFPAVDGLEAGTTSQLGKELNIVPIEPSLIPRRFRVGI